MNDSIDDVTGLLTRDAFLAEVREAHASMPERVRRGCFLILYFPVLGNLPNELDEDALKDLLTIVKTRFRRRDLMGRISRHSLCLWLKACRETDAITVADQYAALLSDVVVQAGSERFPMDMRYRVVPLDLHGKRPRQGISRVVIAPPPDASAQFARQFSVGGNIVDLTSSKVVSLNKAREDRVDAAASVPVQAARPDNTVVEVGGRDTSHAWRLRPGMLIKARPMVCCLRMQPVAVVRMSERLQYSDLMASVLAALALRPERARPAIETQLVMPIDASQLDESFPEWINDRCTHMRVATADICLSLSTESMSHRLRSVAPVLRALNGVGIRLMLEEVGASSQLRMMMNIARFDYLYISGRMLNDSLTSLPQRVELETMIAQARQKECEICAGGVDSPALLEHALSVGIEIGFGRVCGVSTAFPEHAWVESDRQSQ